MRMASGATLDPGQNDFFRHQREVDEDQGWAAEEDSSRG